MSAGGPAAGAVHEWLVRDAVCVYFWPCLERAAGPYRFSRYLSEARQPRGVCVRARAAAATNSRRPGHAQKRSRACQATCARCPRDAPVNEGVEEEEQKPRRARCPATEDCSNCGFLHDNPPVI